MSVRVTENGNDRIAEDATVTERITEADAAQIFSWIFASGAEFFSLFERSHARAQTPPAAVAEYQIARNGVPIGTMTWAASEPVAQFAAFEASPDFVPGDVLAITEPEIPEPVIAGLVWTLIGRQVGAAPIVEAHGNWVGAVPANTEVFRWLALEPLTFPASLPGSKGASATTTTTGKTFSLRHNGVAFGTMVWAAGASVATFTAATATAFAAGDVLTIVAPTSSDATLAHLAWALVATPGVTIPLDGIEGSWPGIIPASAIIERYIVAQPLSLLTGMPESRAECAVAATAATTIAVQRNLVTVGSINFAIGATEATFSLPGRVNFGPGDVLTLTGPASPDATLASLVWSLAVAR